MKTTVLFGSPRKNGFTSALLGLFLDGRDTEVTIYNMYDENVAPCLGCGKCDSSGKCFYDDTEHILQSVRSSERVIIASPAYNYSFPSPMKAFLDRLQPYFCKGIDLNKRKGFLLVTCGASGKFTQEIMEKQCDIAFSELSCEFFGSFVFNHTDKRTALHDDELRKVKLLADKFFTTES